MVVECGAGELVIVPLEDVELPSRLCTPEPRCPVSRGRYNVSAVRAEGRICHCALMACEHGY